MIFNKVGAHTRGIRKNDNGRSLTSLITLIGAILKAALLALATVAR